MNSQSAKNLNEDKPWEYIDIQDLRASLQIGRTLVEIADFLMRRPDEVAAKIKELGLPAPQPG